MRKTRKRTHAIQKPVDRAKKEQPIDSASIARFKKEIWRFFRAQGRHNLPWRKTDSPYAILVSEIMLQQTQVARVEGFYDRFLKQFPDFKALARASVSEVLAAWQGLGYNRRALALKRIAETVMQEHGGKLPEGRAALEALPGIGSGTSGSLMAFVFNKPEPFIETNIRRVFIHYFFPHARKKVTDDALLRYIEHTLAKEKNPREWYWALMDYGAVMGKRGTANIIAKTGRIANPNRKSAQYKKQPAFKGSDREMRGRIIRILLAANGARGVSHDHIAQTVAGHSDGERVSRIISRLAQEGFIIRKGNKLYLAQ